MAGMDILSNIVILLIVTIIYSTYPFENHKKLSSHTFFVGCSIGLLGILIMLSPMVIEQGVQFDARSVLIGVTSMVFGFFPALIGSFMMTLFRIALGGKGVITGIAIIVMSLVVGSVWRVLRFSRVMNKRHYLGLEFLVVGFVLHLLSFLCLFLLPSEFRPTLMQTMVIPFLVYYPIGFYLICLLLFSQVYRVNAVQKLQKSDRQFKTIFEQSPIGMSLTDMRTGEIMNVNQSYLDLLGIEREDLKSFSWDAVTHPDDRPASQVITERMMQGERGPFNLDKRFIRKDGTVVWGNLSLCVFEPTEEDTLESLCMTIDITERKSEEDKVRFASTHDLLTGLYNRSHFEEYVGSFSSEGKLPLTVAFSDVNGLRIINEAFGREQGNLLLQNISSIILTHLGEGNYSARVGGDEIALILFNTNMEEAEQITKKISSEVSDLLVMGSVRTSISFGLCEMQNSTDDINEIIKYAEERVNTRKLMESHDIRGHAVYAIMNTLHEKNKREELHSRRVSTFCASLATALEMSDLEVSEMKLLGLMHDIGKIAICETILNKEGALTKSEWGEMKRHPEIGYRILTSVDDMASLSISVLAHHERYDGTGYPKGLKGLEIPLQARIIAIADAFDAMTSTRTYRECFTIDQAVQEIRDQSGSQFDPKLAKIFVEEVLNKPWQVPS